MARPVAVRDGPRAKEPRASSNHYSLVRPVKGDVDKHRQASTVDKLHFPLDKVQCRRQL